MASLSLQQQNNSAENNRTMLFQISRIDVKLISPDRKSVLLSKPFRDISHCSQGIQHPDNFGFICRDANSENYVCYVFKCLSSSVADEITAGNFSENVYDSDYVESFVFSLDVSCSVETSRSNGGRDPETRSAKRLRTLSHRLASAACGRH